MKTFLLLLMLTLPNTVFAHFDEQYAALQAYLLENPELVGTDKIQVTTKTCGCVKSYHPSLDVNWGSECLGRWTCSNMRGDPPVGWVFCCCGSIISACTYPIIAGLINLGFCAAEGIAKAADHQVQRAEQLTFTSQKNLFRYNAGLLIELINRFRGRPYLENPANVTQLYLEWAHAAGVVANAQDIVPDMATFSLRVNQQIIRYRPVAPPQMTME